MTTKTLFSTLIATVAATMMCVSSGFADTLDDQEAANKALVEKLFNEGFSGGHLDVVEAIFSPDIAFYDANLPPGIEGIKAIVIKNNSTFDDWHFILHDVLADGDKVMVRWTGTGVHARSFMGEKPTGKQVSLNGLAIYQVRDNRIVSDWVIPDNLQFLMQLGALSQFKMAGE